MLVWPAELGSDIGGGFGLYKAVTLNKRRRKSSDVLLFF
jgi:hypothetical protein